MNSLGAGVIAQIRRYLLDQDQHDWIAEQGHEALSLRELLEVIRRDRPDDEQGIVHLIVKDMVFKANGNEPERTRQKQEAEEFWDGRLQLASCVPATDCRFNNFSVKGRSETVKEAFQAVKDWVMQTGPPMLVLAGPPGTGKTHLAIAAATSLTLHRDEPVTYRNETDMLGELQQSIRANQLEETIAAIKKTYWLFWDDLGMAALTDWSRSIVDRIIDHRWQLAGEGIYGTMICTNLYSNDLPPRIASRLLDKSRSRVVTIDDSDFRIDEGIVR